MPNNGGKSHALNVETFVDSILDYAIIGLDAHGRISTWNTGAERLKGYTATEILGRDLSTFYPEVDQRAGLPTSLLGRARDEGHVEHTGWRVRKDGTQFWGNVIISAVRDSEGNLLGYAKVTRDLTERMLAEQREHQLTAELEQANRMKSAFLANMSHEVRTPLNGVIGMLTLLADTELSETQRDLAATAHRSSVSLLRIVNDILDFSKIEAGRMEIESVPFSVTELVSDVTHLFEPQARAKFVDIKNSVAPELPTHVLGDVGRLRQVLANLVGNGVKFTAKGNVSVSATAAQMSPDAVRVRFEVADTGVGFNEAESNRLFEAFSQADVSTTRRFGGTGLGLPISRHLIDLMGGQLELFSEPGQGSRFYFELTFPIVRNATVRLDASATLRPHGPHPAGGRGRVLLAEDNEVNQQVGALTLQSLGFDVHVVGNGQEAVTAMEIDTFDLVLMDCQMPVLDGFEATQRIRLLEGTAGRTPIIAVTASAMPQERQKCFDAGMDDFIAKPILRATLDDVLTRVMSGASNAANS